MAEVKARGKITIINLNDGKPGEPGKDGMNAISLIVLPSHITIETDNKGILQLDGQNKARIFFFDGLTPLTPDNVEIKPYNCSANYANGTLTITSIDKVDGASNKVHPNGHIEITARHHGSQTTTSLTFYVSKQKWNESEFANTIERLNSVKREIQTDYQGKIRTVESKIEQTVNNIDLSLTSLPFNSRNLLKGASMRFPQIFNLTGKSEYFTFKEKGGPLNLPTLTLSRTGAPSDEWNNLRTPAIQLAPNQTYTFSAHARGNGNVYYEIRAAATPDMANHTTLTSGTLQGQWTAIARNFTPPTNKPYIQLVFGIQRNGHYNLSGLQIEKGNHATPWVDPDFETGLERTGVNIKKGIIDVQADTFQVRNTKGELTAYVDKDGNFIATTLKTQNKGKGYIHIHDGVLEAYNALNNKQITLGVNAKTGETTLSFYDKMGNFICDLDPSKAGEMTNRNSSWKTIRVTKLSDNTDTNTLDSLKANENLIWRIKNLKKDSFTFMEIYGYTAPFKLGAYRSDGYWNGEETKKNDGLIFHGKVAAPTNRKVTGIFITEEFFTRERFLYHDEQGRPVLTSIEPEFLVIKNGSTNENEHNFILGNPGGGHGLGGFF